MGDESGTARGGYTPIESHGFLADGRTSALVGPGGSIDWMCAPRFDGPSVFARILDRRRGGSFTLAPPGPGVASSRRYLPDTNVLATTWAGRDGEIVVLDLLALEDEGTHGPGEIYPRGELVRLVECRAGALEIEARVAARPDYGRAAPGLRRSAHGHLIEGGGQRLAVRGDRPLVVDGQDLVSRFRLRAGERAAFSLAYAGRDPDRDFSADAAREALAATTHAWRAWAGRLRPAVLYSSSTISAEMNTLSTILADAPFHFSEAPTKPELLGKYCRVLSVPARLRILEALEDAVELSVGELVERLGLPQPTVSNHLVCLRWCGFVATRREHRTVYNRIADPRVTEVMKLARSLLEDNAEHVAACQRA